MRIPTAGRPKCQPRAIEFHGLRPHEQAAAVAGEDVRQGDGHIQPLDVLLHILARLGVEVVEDFLAEQFARFNVQAAKNWSKLWLSKVAEPASGSLKKWNEQLTKYGVNNKLYS